MGNLFRWKQNGEKETVVSKIVNVTKSQESIKEQIVNVTQRLDAQTRTLDAAVKRFEMRDAEIFKKVVRAMENREHARANIYATELSEIRKIEKMLSHASLALQSVSIRLNTVSEMGDLVTVLSPASTVLNSIRSEMGNIMPEASQELGNIGGILSEICSTTSSQYTDNSINVQAANEEALKILEEAEVVAGNRLKNKLPEMPHISDANKRRHVEA
ncbi:MAG: Snf7 family protein [Candidatus Bathyarchaeota archaeon]|nr:Snf7 family protein [Candidatus Termiticorpusculum sp.]